MTIIPTPPEDYKETKIFKLFLSKSNHVDGLAEKVTCFINNTRPIQDFILAGPFGNFTLHNPNHSKKLLHLADYVIPTDTLKNLSVLELAAIIMSFYLHDLGMVLVGDERNKTISSDDFIEFIESKTEYQFKIDKLREKLKESNTSEQIVLETNIFQIYEAALADYLRPLHATREKYLSLIQFIKTSSGRGDLFDVTGVSFENELIQICISHNLDSSALLETEGIYKERFPRDQVIGSFQLNSQYCCAILRMVDILDFDKERTPQSLFNALGIQSKRFPGFEISLAEWNKHLSVQTLSFDGQELVVSADSKHPSIEHAIVEFCKIIEREIRETQTILKKNREEITKKYQLNLPLSVRPAIRSIGYLYKDFSIKLNEASIINLLMGENLYADSKVSIRELIQNSIDACCLRAQVEKGKFDPEIEINIRKDSDSRFWLKISDNGIGMDEFVLTNYFFKVGNSYYNSTDFRRYSSKNKIENFTPISRFGIGLLSVFMIGEMIKVTTQNGHSPRNDKNERTLLIDGTDSLAIVTEKQNGRQGTIIEVLLRKGFDTETYLTKLYGYVKENIIRPHIPISLTDLNGTVIKIQQDNYIRYNNKIQNVLDNSGIKVIEVDFASVSKLLKGKAIFFFFKNEDGSYCYYDKKNKVVLGIYPLKETYIFENFFGGSRITVNGISMRLKKIGKLFNLGSRITSVALDIEVNGEKEIMYDVSRDRVLGEGMQIIRKEIFEAITKGLSQSEIADKLDEETVTHFEKSRESMLPPEPLNREILRRIDETVPEENRKEKNFEEIGLANGISKSQVNKYIKAIHHLKRKGLWDSTTS